MARSHDEKRMELREHLGELRTHLIRSAWYLILGSIIAYQFFTPLYAFIYRPLDKEMRRLTERRIAIELKQQFDNPDNKQFDWANIPPPHDPPTKEDVVVRDRAALWNQKHPVVVHPMSSVFNNFYDPFTVRLKVSILFGLIIVTPFVIRELALFLLPALTPQERRPIMMMMPLSILLLIFGVVVAYATMFFAMAWFLSYLDDFPQGATLMQSQSDYVVFFIKMMAAFGIAFQLPVVLMAGAFAGVVTSKGLIKNWRWGVVLAAAGGLFTPSNDIISMALMSVPLLFLYFGSILLVKMVERHKEKNKHTFKPV